MYALIRTLPARRLACEQLPLFAASLLIAETFYKFHSFSLECLAFLATWGAMDAVVHAVKSRISRST